MKGIHPPFYGNFVEPYLLLIVHWPEISHIMDRQLKGSLGNIDFVTLYLAENLIFGC